MTKRDGRSANEDSSAMQKVLHWDDGSRVVSEKGTSRQQTHLRRLRQQERGFQTNITANEAEVADAHFQRLMVSSSDAAERLRLLVTLACKGKKTRNPSAIRE
eukprot:TRINITY_DN20567_c0_g1_i2.p2 TRINITY_DN20567_c0_g1~~TRINITY_DN20567_c0_g1_i2.p2  ORF type:complete len:103 (+),score=3.18 TRINITY_DN20567_c0_g1_i2:94-402(+)